MRQSLNRPNLLEAAFPLITTGIGLLSLLIGTVTPDARLEISGVALNPWLYLCLAVFAGCLACRKSDLQLVALMLLPTVFMLVSVFWSLDAEYGLTKYTNLVSASLITIVFFIGAIRSAGIEVFLRCLVFLLLGLLLGALLYKLQYGFFDRQVPYLLNGPIVFARLMGMAALAALFSLRGVSRTVLCVAFFLAVAWTGSKGPLLALTGVLALAIWKSLHGRGRVAFALLALSATAALVGLFAYAIIDLGSSRLMAIVDILTWNRSAFESRTSAGVRLLAYVDTIDLIVRHPFGVGLGSWSYYIDTGFGLYYPHNLFLEVLSEAGILAGSISLIPFLLFIFIPGPLAFRSAAFFFLLAQQVSGDLLDARYLLVFSTLCCWYRWQMQPIPAREPLTGYRSMPQALRAGYA